MSGRAVRSLWAHEVVRYAVFGLGVNGGYVLLFAGLLALGIHYLGALALSQAAAVAVAFPVYRRRVFRSARDGGTAFGRFLGVWSTAALGSILGVPFLVQIVGMPPLPAQVLAVVVVAAGSYLAHRAFTFGAGR